jgi:hypothetical protein
MADRQARKVGQSRSDVKNKMAEKLINTVTPELERPTPA